MLLWKLTRLDLHASRPGRFSQHLDFLSQNPGNADSGSKDAQLSITIKTAARTKTALNAYAVRVIYTSNVRLATLPSNTFSIEKISIFWNHYYTSIYCFLAYVNTTLSWVSQLSWVLSVIMVSLCWMPFCPYVGCHYVECRFAHCCGVEFEKI